MWTSGSLMSASSISTTMSVTREGQEYHDQTARGWRKIIDKRIPTHRQSHPSRHRACLGTWRWMSSPTTWLGNKSSACSPLVRKTVSKGPMSRSQSAARTKPRRANQRAGNCNYVSIVNTYFHWHVTRGADTRWHVGMCLWSRGFIIIRLSTPLYMQIARVFIALKY